MKAGTKDFDAVVVGSGPNGLAAAITLKQQGLSVLVLEAKSMIGGGMRSSDLTLPGFTHDVCSAVLPLAAGSPFFSMLPLQDYGLEYVYPEISAAHPFDDGNAATLTISIGDTARSLNGDAGFYAGLMTDLLKDWPKLKEFVLGPLSFPKHPAAAAKFGLRALRSADGFINSHLHGKEGRGFWAGMAAHSLQPLTNLDTNGFALTLLLLGHEQGWPIVKGGTQQLANALSAYFISLGGKIEVNTEVNSLDNIPSSHAVLFDLTPRQILKIAGGSFSDAYRSRLEKYRYGMGVFKIDWALSEPVPFRAHDCRRAGTVHLGNTYEEIALSEKETAEGKHASKPFVLLTQPSVLDPMRAPAGKHTAWAYCHVPNGSTVDMTDAIENQVERFAPGFKDTILAKHAMNTAELTAYNSNYIGGDINGGVQDIAQLFTRPVLAASPYRTSAKRIYIASSSTPPGGGVHGMCGYHAAKRALKDIFNIKE